MRGRAPRTARERYATGGASPTVRISILECYVPADGTSAATLKERRLRYVPLYMGQLPDKLLLAYMCT